MEMAQFMNRNYVDAVRLYAELARQFPHVKIKGVKVAWAFAYGLLDRQEEASAAVKDILETYPA